jgi:serine protease inhibitor
MGNSRRLVALGLVAALAGCARSAPAATPPEPGTLTVAGVSRLAPTADAPVGAVVAGLSAFAGRLRQAVLTPGKNAVYSPLSIAYAFAMLRAGATGRTATQLDALFGYPAGVHQAYNALTHGLVTTAGPPPRPVPGATRDPNSPPAAPVVSIANGLFLQDGVTPGQPFLRTLAEQYGAPARTVDFAGGTAAKDIDAWVRRQTADRIQRLFDHLGPATVAVIANAVYLKADWQSPFEPSATRDEPFRRVTGGSAPAPTMHATGSYRYAAGTGWQAVELPYGGGELAMWVLVPTGSTPPAALLDPAVLAAATSTAHPEHVALSLPRWDFGTDLDLMPVLRGLGLTDLGGLTGIAPGVAVDQVVHRANITVDEAGTEAAAVTGIAVATSGQVGVPVTVRADHPFAFAIVHKASGAPLFVGQVADPTAK